MTDFEIWRFELHGRLLVLAGRSPANEMLLLQLGTSNSNKIREQR